jgi:Nif-specific regulatory protein
MNAPSSARATVLQSCGILFLFRALREARDQAGQGHIEAQIAELVMDFTGADGAAILLAAAHMPLRPSAAARPDLPLNLSDIAEHISSGNPWVDEESTAIACPIREHGRVAGMMVAWFEDEASLDFLETQLDTLTGIATLAGSALDAAGDAPLPPKPQMDSAPITIPGVIAESPAMQRVLRMVRRVAPAETTVLIEGESGTGKEVIARTLHNLSLRKARPFVAINCAVLTENLLESELFGHEKGAFTGAVSQKQGKMELAEGGTLFLDEIGELAPGLQAKMLRVLQQREFERVGGTRTIRLDIRLVAATNRDLRQQVRKGEFREDLYHRLNVISITSPPLRERPDDILALAMHFLDASRSKVRRDIRGISKEARSSLIRYPWPGNVRELENAIERAVVLGESEFLQTEDLPDAVWQEDEKPAPPDFELSISSAKREAILKAWAESNGDYKKAAELLGIHPNSVLRLVRKLNLRSELKR